MAFVSVCVHKPNIFLIITERLDNSDQQAKSCEGTLPSTKNACPLPSNSLIGNELHDYVSWWRYHRFESIIIIRKCAKSRIFYGKKIINPSRIKHRFCLVFEQREQLDLLHTFTPRVPECPRISIVQTSIRRAHNDEMRFYRLENILIKHLH